MPGEEIAPSLPQVVFLESVAERVLPLLRSRRLPPDESDRPNLDFYGTCYDNETYGNTGVQRSASTPYGARTTTSQTRRSGRIPAASRASRVTSKED